MPKNSNPELILLRTFVLLRQAVPIISDEAESIASLQKCIESTTGDTSKRRYAKSNRCTKWLKAYNSLMRDMEASNDNDR